jgi:predicted kinase
MELGEQEVPEAERTRALEKARAHWLLALGELEEPGRRPCLLLIGGLPGAGKSTLARNLAEPAGFTVIRSDVVRKELAGEDREDANPHSFAKGRYSLEWNERTYAECLRRAELLFFEGHRVGIDATFREEHRRRLFVEAALRWGLPVVFLLCQASAEVVRARLALRKEDASDADWAVYLQAASQWEEPTPATRRLVRTLDASGEPGQVLGQALAVLRSEELDSTTLSGPETGRP